VRFADGSELEVGAVIWATGYRPDYSWIDLGVFEPDGSARHHRGLTEVPGFYFLGLTWQHTRGSALLGWVKDDAAYIAGLIAESARHAAGADAPGHAERIRR
jgi:putative flavoprotein involved in K+ transport